MNETKIEHKARKVRRANLKPVLVEAIAASRLGGLSYPKIAAAFGLALSTVFAVCRRQGVS